MAHDPFLDLSRRVRDFIRALTPAEGAAHPRESFDRLARDLFIAQFEAVVPYRRFAAREGVTPDSLTGWRAIPAVPTAAFKELEFTSLTPSERTVVFHSSGTTSQAPSRHFHNAASLELYAESLRPWFKRHLLPEPHAGPRLRFLALTPPASTAPHSSLAWMLAAVMDGGEAWDSAWFGGSASDEGWDLRVAALLDFLAASVAAGTPVCLLGTAFSFVQLLDAMESAGRSLSLPAGSRVMETGGYKGRSRALPRAELHDLISRRLGVPRSHIISEYGMSELSSQAYDGVVGGQGVRRFRFPPWVRAVVISPETGEEVADGGMGLLRVYDLANVRSVLAIQTEDLAVRCGDGFELLGRASQAEPRGCSLMAA